MRIGWLLVLALGLTAGLTFGDLKASADDQESALDKIVDTWSPPQSGEGSQHAFGSRQGLIKLVTIETASPFGDVWNFYSKKIGVGKEYAEKKGYVHHGKTEVGEFFLRDRVFGEAPRQAQFVITNEASTVSIHLTTQAEGTQVEMTVVAHR